MAASSAPRKATKKKAPAPSPAAAKKPASVADFRSNTMTGNSLITLPSGMVVEVRRPGMHEFMQAGILPDSLRPLVAEMVEKGQRKTPSQRKAEQARLNKAMQATITDAEALAGMMRAMQRIAAQSWISPPLKFHEELISAGHGPEWVTIPDSERDLDAYLYTDEVSQDDLSFTFNFVAGGTGDLERFREQSGEVVAALLGGEDVGVQAK